MTEMIPASRYCWRGDGFHRTADATVETARRALALRLAGNRGPERRTAELEGSRRIAERLAGALSKEITHVTVAQSLLPFLWLSGALGGREVTVLMTRLPMGMLQARLDAANVLHPERRTLSDFRAPGWLVDAEAQALASAAHIVTPHAEIAIDFAGRAKRLDWHATPAAAVGKRRPLPALRGQRGAERGGADGRAGGGPGATAQSAVDDRFRAPACAGDRRTKQIEDAGGEAAWKAVSRRGR